METHMKRNDSSIQQKLKAFRSGSGQLMNSVISHPATTSSVDKSEKGIHDDEQQRLQINKERGSRMRISSVLNRHRMEANTSRRVRHYKAVQASLATSNSSLSSAQSMGDDSGIQREKELSNIETIVSSCSILDGLILETVGYDEKFGRQERPVSVTECSGEKNGVVFQDSDYDRWVSDSVEARKNKKMLNFSESSTNRWKGINLKSIL
uniref:Uncharacterized protein n=1 Tax=Timspurckia oligopyrenoides TaxID=708627 RepID=A0A6T6N8M7_9RHOD|mmetsp:Transcript_6419/g.11427  ORF Transcript_6419/g.11427 Transcript_6419/m.11427 type:complete len:209 (+) Transcript_6419:189-815(+)